MRRTRSSAHRTSSARAGAAGIAAFVLAIEVLLGTGVVQRPAAAWVGGCRGAPTPAQQKFNGVDLARSAHQWFASRSVAILKTDGFDGISQFLSTPDPSAPPSVDPNLGTPRETTETYGWRLVIGSAEADCSLYSQMPDHLHNFWSHKGRRMIVGESAASYAEMAYARAIAAWGSGDRSAAMGWLGASLHLVQDACVPQHNFYGIGINHSSYEHWVGTNRDALAVDGGAIVAGDFRRDRGHGGQQWSSANPRGWADECAHRSARVLRAASANVPKSSSPLDPQWQTAAHVADAQRLGAGYLKLFFDAVGGP